MAITTIQKVIKIGSSRGVTLPARGLRALGVEAGDEVELVVRKKTTHAEDAHVLEAAQSLLKRYEDDFRHLAGRLSITDIAQWLRRYTETGQCDIITK